MSNAAINPKSHLMDWYDKPPMTAEERLKAKQTARVSQSAEHI